jgi:hypothetical protein
MERPMTKSGTAKTPTKTNPSKAAATPNRTRSTERSTLAEQSKPAPAIAVAPTASQTNLTKPSSKQDQLAALLVRDEGASLDQMVVATGWLPHTTRAAMTGLKKKGYVISSDKIDGLRTYRAVAPQ